MLFLFNLLISAKREGGDEDDADTGGDISVSIITSCAKSEYQSHSTVRRYFHNNEQRKWITDQKQITSIYTQYLYN